jgi:hypothetical protein
MGWSTESAKPKLLLELLDLLVLLVRKVDSESARGRNWSDCDDESACKKEKPAADEFWTGCASPLRKPKEDWAASGEGEGAASAGEDDDDRLRPPNSELAAS